MTIGLSLLLGVYVDAMTGKVHEIN